MATTTQIALSEYLQTSYRPDLEFVDGELQERSVGKTDHARVQAQDRLRPRRDGETRWILRFREPQSA
jgi:hypothetical protein